MENGGTASDGTECTGIGLDTSDESLFPKDERARLPRPEYSNVWEVTIDEEGKAALARRVILDLGFLETVLS